MLRTTVRWVLPWVLLLAAACGTSKIVDPGKGDGDSGAVPDAGGFSDVDANNTCERVDVEGVRGIPNVLVVLDRSGSMAEDNRWNQAVPAVNNVVQNLQSNVAFGLMLYAGGDTCGTGEVVVAPAVETGGDIASALDDTEPEGGTPTAASLAAARSALAGVEGASYVVLVTDGAPNCNGSLSRNSCTCTCATQYCYCAGFGGAATNCLDDTRAVEAVTALKDAGIPVYVIGFDAAQLQPPFVATLNAMAAAGGTQQTEFIPVTDGTSLETAIADLAGNVISCSYMLDSTPSDPRYVRVKIDDVEVPMITDVNPTNGWDLNGQQLVLHGSTCDALKNTEGAKLTITVECELVVR